MGQADIHDLGDRPVAGDTVGLLEGLATTRSIRRYRDDPVPDAVLRDILFAATRAPSGSNRQPFRFVVLRDGPKARQARTLLGESARAFWAAKVTHDGYDQGSGTDPSTPKARMARTMQHYVDQLERAPVVILPCLVRYRVDHPGQGASIYPACQNLLLAARALGYGGVFTGFQEGVVDQLRELLDMPDQVWIAGTITLGRPEGAHGPVRRRPLPELVFEDSWDHPAPWAIDPPGTAHTAAGPPRPDR